MTGKESTQVYITNTDPIVITVGVYISGSDGIIYRWILS